MVRRKKKKKAGGAFGHFFIDLSPAIKKLVLERIRDNKKRIQTDSYLTPAELARYLKKKTRKKNANGEEEEFDFSGGIFGGEKSEKVDSFVPKTTLSIMKEKAMLTASSCDYDCGTDTVTEMLEEIFLLTKKLERAAIGVQRMRRIKITEVCADVAIHICVAAVYFSVDIHLLYTIVAVAVTSRSESFKKYFVEFFCAEYHENSSISSREQILSRIFEIS